MILLNILQLPFFVFRMWDHFSEELDQQKLSIMPQPENMSLILIIKMQGTRVTEIQLT